VLSLLNPRALRFLGFNKFAQLIVLQALSKGALPLTPWGGQKVVLIGKVALVYRGGAVRDLRDLPVLTIFWTVPISAPIFPLGTISECKGTSR